MTADPIVEEIHQFRQAHAASMNFDLWAIFRELKEEERGSGRHFIPRVATLTREVASSPAKMRSREDDDEDEGFLKIMAENRRQDWWRTAIYEGWDTEDGGCI